MSEQGDRSWKARTALERATTCGCYYCLSIYHPSHIEEWVDGNQTAICPKCGIDSVIPFVELIDIDLDKFKEKLKDYYKKSFTDL